ncbi:type III secretion system needle filament subunit SctF [Plesiomonas sp.]|uniref:type III secretion system needle filament subunit SctF n=1 Tax=Plesiomonas sp. TaxID=2486279 RepID=UPI003F2AD2CF
MNITQLIDSLSQMAASSAKDLENKMSPSNINDPEQMLKAQFAVQQYSTYIGYSSAVIRTIKDMLSGIIAKI